MQIVPQIAKYFARSLHFTQLLLCILYTMITHLAGSRLSGWFRNFMAINLQLMESTVFIRKATYGNALAGLLMMVMSTAPALVAGQVSEWKFESQRDAISPRWYVDSKVKVASEPTLAISGGGKEYADGHWYRLVNVEPGRYYKFQTTYQSKNVEEPDRCVQARLIWLDTSGKQLGFTEYPGTVSTTQEGWSLIEKIYQAPPETAKAKLELHYRWDANGSVHFTPAKLVGTTAPQPRPVRLATVYLKPHNSPSPQNNLDQFAALVKQAADQHADFVCLPEAITMVGTGLSYVGASEPIPGPSTDYLGKVAKENNVYIIAGLLEKEGDVAYNTSVLINRQGNFVGKYRKISLPREEIDGGLTPGRETPVFDTEFGKVGMMICWDVTFPETARALARNGAEIIFMPIAGGYVKLAMARALENQIYLVSSTYDMISAVFDLEGNVIAEATPEHRVVVTEVDLSARMMWPWIGDLKSRIPRERPTTKAVYPEMD
jgi:predicted amidohydrolase